MEDREERLLTVKQITERLQVSQDSVYRWLADGRLKGVRLGGTRVGWRISEKDLREFLEKRRGQGI